MRVVRDDADLLVLWLAPGTQIAWWSLPDGRDPRAVPVDRRFHQRMSTSERTWQGSGVLRVVPVGAEYQVVHFWDGEGAFEGWYVNLERRLVRPEDRRDRGDTLDRHLDLVVAPDLSARWKDEDEATAAVAAGHLPALDLASARRTGDEVLADLPGWLETVGDWRGWTPADGWDTPLRLPADWRD